MHCSQHWVSWSPWNLVSMLTECPSSYLPSTIQYRAVCDPQFINLLKMLIEWSVIIEWSNTVSIRDFFTKHSLQKWFSLQSRHSMADVTYNTDVFPALIRTLARIRRTAHGLSQDTE